LPEGAEEEIPIRKTNCLSHAEAGRVFVFPEFLMLLRQISGGQRLFAYFLVGQKVGSGGKTLIFWSFLIKPQIRLSFWRAKRT